MSTYNSIIDRADAKDLIPEEVSREIIQALPEQSIVMRLARRVPMSRYQTRMPVLSALAYGYFVDGDTGLKQTTNLAWTNRYLYAEELAVIVPVPQNVLDDAEFDIWGQVRPRITEAFGRVIDAAILFGVNKPALWPNAIVTAATSAGHTVSLAASTDIIDAVGGEDGIMTLVEADGFSVTAFAAYPTIRANLRGARTADGALIYMPSLANGAPSTLYGLPIEYAANGAWDDTAALLICGEWSQIIIGERSDISFTILREAVIQDASGNIIFNLAQQDMVALRATMRIAFQVANPITNLEQTEANRYPFAVLTP